MKKISMFLISAILFTQTGFSQLSGTKTIPGDYATIAAAIADLNAVGVVAPGVTFNVAAGYTETFASPTSGLITATGTTPNDQIIFQRAGAGADPLITAGVGTSTTVDGIIVIRGGNYITFDGIDLQESAANVTTTTQMEWGYALVKASATDGAQYNIIKNCTVTLNKANTNSAGIYSGNHTNTSTTALTVTSITGTNSVNKIYGNTISNAFTGIYVKGFTDVSPYTYYDQNNEIGVTAGNIISNYGGASSCYGIYLFNNNAAKISNNTISNTGTTATLRGIYLSSSTNANVDVINNDISLNSSATTNQCTGIENAITGTTNTININNNNIHNCTYSTATTGTFQGIYNNGGSAATLNINNNTVNINTLAGTGTMTLIDGGSATTLNMNSNTVSNNTKTGASGTLYCTKAATGAITYDSNIIQQNGFTATSGTSAASLYGYYNMGSPTVENYTNNSFYSLTISGANTSVNNLIYGIYSSTSATSTITVSSNSFGFLTFDNSSTGAVQIQGIRIALGNVNVFKNQILQFTANGANSICSGIYVFGGTTWNIYNNDISDLNAPTASYLNSVIGIYIAGGTTVNAFYNTIYLNATSTSAFFGTSGIYASTTPTVDLRNNIVVNTSTPLGGGYTVAYRRSGTTLTSYAATSNNNDFYAGTPGVNNLIFYDGTNSDQTMGAFQSRVTPSDAASISENPPFVQITPPCDLHLQTTVATLCESGGQKITTPIAITDDFDGNIRWGETGYAGTGTATDIGADEFNGIRPSCVPPTALNASAITNNSATLGWTAGGSETLWNIEWGLNGFTQGNGTTVSGLTTNSYSLTGLTSSTDYSFYVQANCGGSTSTWAGPYSFTTLCDNISAFPFTESFDGATFAPTCWINVKTAGSGTPGIWDRQTTGTYPTCTPHSGAAMARYNSYSLSSGTKGILVTPGLNLPSDLYEVRFWMYRDNGSSSTDLVNVYYNTAPNTTGATLLGTINRSNTLTPVEAIPNQWYEYAFNMPVGSTGNGRYIIFEAVSAWGNNIFVDDVQIQLQPTCPAPSLLTTSGITNNSAILGWTAGGTETLWNVEWGLNGFTQGTGTTVSGLTTNSYNLSGLTSSTDYSFYVQADCSGSTSTWVGPFNFTTLCSPSSIPYSEGFESITTNNQLPSCMAATSLGTKNLTYIAATTYNRVPHTGTNFASFQYAPAGNWFFFAPVQLTGGVSYDASAWYITDGASGFDSLNIAYGTSQNGASMTNIVKVVNPVNTTYQQLKGTFVPATTGIYYIGIQANGTSYSPWYLTIDDILVDLTPSCVAPTALTATSITTTTASLGWTTSGGETAWDIQYGTFGFPLGTGTILNNVSTNPYTLTGLTSATNYQFYVLSQCSPTDSSTWTGPFSFTTLCDNVNTFPFVESFDGATFAPSCWTNVKTAGSGTPGIWDRQTAGTYPTCTPHSGAAMARFNSFSLSSGTKGILVTPGLDLPTDLYEVRFWMYRDNNGASTADLVNVYYNTAPNTTGATLLGTINRSNTLTPAETTPNQWYEYHFNMPVGSTGAGRYVIFEAVSAYGYNIFVDDVQIQLQPTCPAPTALTASSITTTTASLGWTAGGGETLWNIELGLAGFTPTGTPTASGVTNPYNASGLVSATAYDFYVQADCGGSTSPWAGPFSFTTLCSSINSFPWTENFDAVTIPNLPSCWLKENGSWITTNNVYSSFDADAHSGTQFLREQYSATNEYIWTPGFDLTAGTSYDFSFWWAGDNYSGWTGDVFYNTNQNSVGATQLGTSFIVSGTTSSKIYVKQTNTFVPATTGTYYFAIRVNATSNPWYLSFDDFSMGYTPTCIEPSAIVASNITTTSADIAWTAGGSETAWNIQYGVSGFSLGTGTTVSTTATSSGLTSLTPSTSYDVYVQADCGSGDLSTWFGPYTFATSCNVFTTPFTEGFESASAPPTCWSMFYENPTPAAGNLMSHSTDQAFAGNQSFRFSSLDYGAPYNEYLISPEISFAQDMLLTFEYRASDPYTETFSVGTSTTGNNYSTDFTWGSDITDASDANWTKYSAIIPAGTKYIAIQYKSDYMYYLYVDEFTLKVPSTENSVLTFDIPTQISSTVGNGTVDILMPCGTDVTALIPAITVSADATISPASGVAQDFTNPVTYIVTAENGTTSTWIVTVNVSASPIVDLGNDVIQCGGSVTLDAGNAGATYLWSDNSTAQTLTVSTSGTYSVTVNNGCTATDAIDVTINTPVTVDLGTDVTQCGGSVTLDAGNAGATYVWSDNSTAQTLTVSTSGTYSVIVTNTNGCTGTDAIDVTINTLPIVDLGTDITQCGGIVTLDAGNAGATYLWSDNSTAQTLVVSTSDTYSVTVTNSCGTGTDAINITINALPTVYAGADQTICQDTQVNLTGSGTATSYIWDNSVTDGIPFLPTATETYTVVGTDANGCSNTDQVDVTVNALPGPITITENAGVLTSDAVSGNQWYEQVSGIIAGETNQSYTPTQNGNYYVIVTDVNGCTAMSNVISFQISVNSINYGSSILIYPNPTSDYFTLDIRSNNLLSNVNVEIYNYLGQRVILKSFNPNKNSIDEPISLNELVTGNYFVKVFVNDKQWTGSIIKK